MTSTAASFMTMPPPMLQCGSQSSLSSVNSATSIGSNSRPRSNSNPMRRRHALDSLHLQFTKAIVPTRSSSVSNHNDKKANNRVQYVLQVTNANVRSSSFSYNSDGESVETTLSQQQSHHQQRSWQIVKSYHEFYAFKEKLLETLQFGHLCDANCPFLYQHIDHSFPKKRLFGNKRACVIESRLQSLQQFFNDLLQYFRSNNKRPCECPIACEQLPRVLAEFLYESQVPTANDLAFKLSSPISHTSSESCSENEFCRVFASAEINCAEQPENAVVLASLSEDCWICNSALHDNHINTISTLSCGHRFHDECVVAHLNESLSCPICKKSCQL